MILPGNLVRRIVNHDTVPDKEMEKFFVDSCPETDGIKTRTTAIYGRLAAKLSNRSSRGYELFNDMHTNASMCPCLGHKCLRMHSLIALCSFLSLLNIDPETTI